MSDPERRNAPSRQAEGKCARLIRYTPVKGQIMIRGLSIALLAMGAVVVGGCGEPVEENCARACDRWVNQCQLGDLTECTNECLSEGGWGEYTDCIESVECDEFEEFCE